MSGAVQAMALDQALQLPQAEVESLGFEDLALTAAQTAAAGRLWLALLGVTDDGSGAARAAWAEVVGDRPLQVAMHRPAAEVLGWWRRANWEDFGREGDAWAWAVLDRLRVGFDRCGVLAGELALCPELVSP